jgi:hypothetical protein
LHSEELHILYSYAHIITQIKSWRTGWAGNGRGEERKVYKILVGKSMEKSQIGSPRHRCGDGIRMDVKEIDLFVEWIQLAQYRDRWWAVVKMDAGATELVSW